MKKNNELKTWLKILNVGKRYKKQSTKGWKGVRKVLSETYTMSRLRLKYYYYYYLKLKS